MTNGEKSRLLVLYGSQTFTAQEIAERIWRKTKVFGFKGPVQAMDDYPISRLIHEEFALFICATTGQGDEPDNMKRFWKFLLRKNLPNNSLKKLKFGVVGLGDSSYSKFNFVGKKLHKRLLQLGATPLLNIALCDYQHDLGHDAVLMPWMDNFFGTMKSYFPNIQTDIMNNLFIPRWNVSLIKTDCGDNKLNEYSEDIYYGKGRKDHFLDATYLEVERNDRTTDESHFQDVRHMVFKTIDDVPVEYTPGDIFNIRPRNSKEDIEDLFSIFEMHNIDIKPYHLLSVEEYHDDMPVPDFLKLPLTLYEVAEQYWDLKAYPTQYFFSLLALISEDKLERDKCMELSSPEGQEDWLNYCRRPRRTVLEIEKDMANYTQYKMGFSQTILMVKGAIPSKFYCQEEGRKRLSDTTLSKTASMKRVKIEKETQAAANMPGTSTLEDENNMPETAVYMTRVKIEKQTQATADMPGTGRLEDENILPVTAVYMTHVKIEKETQADVAGTSTLEDENNMLETAVYMTRVKIEKETQAAADMPGTGTLEGENVLPETDVHIRHVKIEKVSQAAADMPRTGTLEYENNMPETAEITDNMSAYHTKLPVVSTVHVDVPSLVKKFSSMKAELEEMRDRLEASESTIRDLRNELLQLKCNNSLNKVLHDFHKSTSKLTIDILFELLSTIKPRSFSIAGSCLKSEGRKIELLIVVVKYYSKLKKARLGLASNWLKNLNIGNRVFGWIKKGTMKFPQDTSIPLILIGPGTGLAPFRNLLQERCIRGTASNKTLHLFFGCRYKTKDFHCRDELEGMVESGELSLYCAFSRDQENKIYVQHKISEYRETLWSLLSRGGYIFISGNAKNMPDNVRDAFIEVVISKTGDVSLEDARKMLSDMERNNRLQVETW